MDVPPPKLSHFIRGSRSPNFFPPPPASGQCVLASCSHRVWKRSPSSIRAALVCLHGGIPLGAGGAVRHFAAGGAVNFMSFLRGALRVQPQTDAFARRLTPGQTCQLAGRVEMMWLGVLQQSNSSGPGRPRRTHGSPFRSFSCQGARTGCRPGARQIGRQHCNIS